MLHATFLPVTLAWNITEAMKGPPILFVDIVLTLGVQSSMFASRGIRYSNCRTQTPDKQRLQSGLQKLQDLELSDPGRESQGSLLCEKGSTFHHSTHSKSPSSITAPNQKASVFWVVHLILWQTPGTKAMKLPLFILPNIDHQLCHWIIIHPHTPLDFFWLIDPGLRRFPF